MWGKRRKAKTTRAWGFRSTMEKAPSKRRPATRKKWVAKVTRLTLPDAKRHLRPPSNKGSRNMPEEKMDWVIGEGNPFPKTSIERWEADILATKLSRQLEEEGRSATREEQRDVAKYSGLGDSAFEQAFSHCGARDPAWQKRRAELEEMVSDEQLEGIRRSCINAFHTPPEIVRAMRKGLSDMGEDKLDSLNVLDPSAGPDRFLGLQPRRTTMKSERTEEELDPMTAGILKHFYPETKVHAGGSMYRGREYTRKSDPSMPVVPTLNREMREMAKDLGPDALRPQRTVPYERPEDFSNAWRKRQTERLVLEDGQLRLSDGTCSRKPELRAEENQRRTALMSLRDTARKLVTMEAEDGYNDEAERTRGALRQQFDNYVADQNGEAINTSTNRKLLVAGADGSLDDQSFDVRNLV